MHNSLRILYTMANQAQSQKVIVNIHPDKKVKKKKKKRKSGRGAAPAGTGSYYRPPAAPAAPAAPQVIHSPQVDLDKYRMSNALTDVSGHIKVLQQRMDNPSAALGNNPLGAAAAIRRNPVAPVAPAPAVPAAPVPSPAAPAKKKRLIFNDPVRQPTISEHEVEPKPQLQTPDRPRRYNKTAGNPEGTKEGYDANISARASIPRPARRVRSATGFGDGSFAGMSALVPAPSREGGASSSSGRTDGILSDAYSAQGDDQKL